MNFFGNRPSTATAKKPTIRKTSVQVPVSKPAPSPAVAPPARQRDTNRFKLSQRPGARSAVSKQTPKTVQRALAPSRGVKRKSATPDVQLFSDEEEDDDSSSIGGSDSDASRKRIKSSVSSVESSGRPRRNIVSEKAFEEDGEPLQFIHAADATSGEHATKFENPWQDEDFATVELQYPSRHQRERFQLKFPRHNDDFKPMSDIKDTIEAVVTFCFPEDLRRQYMDEEQGFGRRFNRAWQRQSVEEWLSIVEEFNGVLLPLVKDGTIQRELDQTGEIHLEWIQRILDQIFVRTVSPKAEILNAYKSGTDNVYGELLPRFVSDIFKTTKLTQNQTFIDLGSGVGNVVLQAALEVGCESWGIEMMKNPCDLAELQGAEFTARTQLWGLDAGSVNLLRGDMTSHPSIPALLHRADVVLVNNQAFTPVLNDKLRDMFLDLKPGAQVVSLKPFVPEGHKMAARNIGSVVNQFVQRKYEYFSDSVSWSYYGNAHWYVATKDLRPLNAFMRKHGLDKT